MKLICGDSREVLAGMDAESIDAVVTDPPYGLEFMGKDWDHGIPGVHFWQVALRVAKPGAHLLAFGGTRTHHRLMCAIEDAGWGIRDCVMWVYGSGFPKSLDVSKAIDKAVGVKREVVRMTPSGGYKRLMVTNAEAEFRPDDYYPDGNKFTSSQPITDAARRWSGWGTALKPAWEPIIVARKPLVGTVAENVQRYGTGAINVDGCRVPLVGGDTPEDFRRVDGPASAPRTNGCYAQDDWTKEKFKRSCERGHDAGRWPANLIHDGSDEVVAVFPATTTSGTNPTRRGNLGYHAGARGQESCYAPRGIDSGSAARFFYCAKASKADRDEGCEGMAANPVLIGAAGHKTNPMTGKAVVDVPRRNHHPTVKPTALMRYLCRLVTPPGGMVLDPFMGSGSTGKAAVLEGFGFIGIEQDEGYVEIAQARIAATREKPSQLELIQKRGT